MRLRLRDHVGRDHQGIDGDQAFIQWLGPLGLGAEQREIRIRFWVPRGWWSWGYWR